MTGRVGWSPGPAHWKDDLTPIAAADWSYDRAAHLLAHAGFGGAPAEIEALAGAGPDGAVRALVHYERIPNPKLQPFVESGLWDPSLNPFPESRPEATDRALATGASMGVERKPAGKRPLQPVSDRFFYWLRATMLETRRLGYWWAGRMLQTTHPLEEKMALLWHGHFATHENKVRDYRKMLQQIALFEKAATGNIRDLAIRVAQNPAMLYFLDAQYNVKGAANENFAREVMELFTMGVGNYSEKDVREGARAFTGWYFDDLSFKIDAAKHDDGPKTFLGRSGNFDGVDALKIIFEQPVTAEYLAGKIYRFLVRDDPRQSAAAKRIIDRAGEEGDPLVVSLMTLLEAEWVLRAAVKLSKSAITAEFRSLLLEASNLIFEDEQAVGWALRLYETTNADFAECLMLAHYQRLGCSSMLTFDARAAKLPGGELLAV